jgi:hypothetical protein
MSKVIKYGTEFEPQAIAKLKRLANRLRRNVQQRGLQVIGLGS